MDAGGRTGDVHQRSEEHEVRIERVRQDANHVVDAHEEGGHTVLNHILIIHVEFLADEFAVFVIIRIVQIPAIGGGFAAHFCFGGEIHATVVHCGFQGILVSVGEEREMVAHGQRTELELVAVDEEHAQAVQFCDVDGSEEVSVDGNLVKVLRVGEVDF